MTDGTTADAQADQGGARFVIGTLMTAHDCEIRPRQLRRLWLAAASGVLLCAGLVYANQVTARHREGALHAFLALRSMDGKALADGELIQTVDGDQVTARLVFHFRDGSLHDETTVFTQKKEIRLVSNRVVQKGPSFPRALEMSLDASRGRVTVKYTTDEGEEKQKSETMDLPPDLANGIVVTLLTNVTPESHPESISFLAATPDPRLVRLKISAAETDHVTTDDETRSAIHYVLKVEIGRLSGLLAGLVGKQPPDSHVWIAGGKVPAFIRAEEPLYVGGPLWRIDIVSPEWKTPVGAR